MELFREDLNLLIDSSAALKYLSAFRQIFSFLSSLGHKFYMVRMWNGAWMRNASAVVMLFPHACITRRVLTS